MSLLQEMTVPCVMLNKRKVSDGAGGFYTEWSEGAEFFSAITYNNSVQAKIAEKQGVTNLYTVTAAKNVELEYHDVFKRVKDGKVFRVTSDGADNSTPNAASINMMQVSAEEWELPR